MWNFRGYIAVYVEEFAKKLLGKDAPDADQIVSGEFVSTMLSVVTMKHGSLDDFSDFKVMCKPYVGVAACEIPEDQAKELFEEFQRIMRL